MSRLVFPRPSTQVPPIRFSAEAEHEDVAGDRPGAAMVLMKSSGSWRVRSAAKEPCLGSTNQTRTAGAARNPVHREFGRTFYRTDRRVPCGLAAKPL